MAICWPLPSSAALRRRALAQGVLALTGAAPSGCFGGGNDGLPEGVSARLTVLATTDLDTNIIGYDYFKVAEDRSVGLDRTTTRIRKARQDFPNTVPIDNGDTIQGTALADYQAIVAPVACSQKLAMYKVMDQLGYDAGSVGKHEFNYGLEWLARVTGSKFSVDGLPPLASQPSCAGPSFPLLSANVISKKDGQPVFKPYVILQRTVKTTDAGGKPTELQVKIAVMPSYWGKALGVIDFNLVVRSGKWAVDTARTQVSLRKTLIDAGGHQQRGRPLPLPQNGVRGQSQRRGHRGVARARGRVLQHHRPGQDQRAGAHLHLPRLQLRRVHLARRELRDRRHPAQGPSHREPALPGRAPGCGQELIIATNNYRGRGGGRFPGLDGSNVIYASPDANRDVLIDYIKARKTLTLAKDGQARSWRFVKVKTAGPVVFTSAAGKLAQAKAAGLDNFSVLREDDGSGKGLAAYAIDLSR